MDKKEYCYISGKISPLTKEQVRPKFEQAEKEVIALGYIPVSPLNNGVDNDNWIDNMASCLIQMKPCKAVYFLMDYLDSSDGALIERITAVHEKKEMIYQLDNIIENGNRQ